MESKCSVRKALASDMDKVYELIQELADFEKMADGPKIDAEVLRRDGFERNPPVFESLVAEFDNKIVGYSIFYFTYSTWEGISLFLEDIYVQPQYRNQSIGSQIFTSVVKYAVDKKCARLDFHVLSWNPAIQFYKRHLAKNLTELEDWNCFRLDNETMKMLCNSN